MAKIFRIFAHTHSSVTKFWMATVFAVYWLNSLSLKGAELEPLVIRQLANLKKEFFYLGLICIAIYEFVGFGSAFNVRSAMKKDGNSWIPPAMSPLPRKLKVLTITYLLVLFLFGGRIYWQLSGIPGLEMVKLFLLLIISWAVAVYFFGLLEHSIFTQIDNLAKVDIRKCRERWLLTLRIIHIVLLSMVAAGTYWQYMMVFK